MREVGRQEESTMNTNVFCISYSDCVVRTIHSAQSWLATIQMKVNKLPLHGMEEGDEKSSCF